METFELIVGLAMLLQQFCKQRCGLIKALTQSYFIVTVQSRVNINQSVGELRFLK